jgi:hypothetical protein
MGSSVHPAGKTWEGMMARCYDPNSPSYPTYGGKGVYVCDRWLEFKAFAEDVENLPVRSNTGRLVLDKDGRGDGFCYGPDHCQWISDRDNALLKSDRIFTVIHPQRGVHSFTNPTAFCAEHGIDNRNFSDLWAGKKNAKTREGWSLVSVHPAEPKLDQIAQVVQTLRTDPDSRRMVVSAWDPYWSRFSGLPPCHMIYQFQVQDGLLSCMMTQRSVDVFLGLPFNIASYALLTHMVAQVTGHKVGHLLLALGDTHLYRNHLEQVGEQLSREERPLPELWLNPVVQEIDQFTPDDMKLKDYNPHPAIKAEVAI